MIDRIKTFVLMLLLGWMSLAAQGISVTSFKPLPSDLTANMAGTQVKDQNGDVAALIKVVTTQTGFSFEGGAAGIVKTRQEVGEVWVYVPHGIKRITVKHPQLGVLRDYYFPCAIEAARTYEMVLATGEVRTVVTQDVGVSYLVLKVEPRSAVVYIDNQLQTNDGSGEIVKALPYGEHQYRVEAGSYMSEAGVVQVGKEKKMLNVKLKSALATLTVNNATDGAEIFINEQSKGLGPWSGNLADGIYVVEAKKAGYRSQKLSVQLVKQEQKAVTIPALEPIYGILNINYKPSGAEVWLDGKQIGTTPDIFKDVLACDHSITIKKVGFEEHKENFALADGEVKELSGALSDNLYPDYAGEIPQQGTEEREYYDKAIMGEVVSQNMLANAFYARGNYTDAVYWYSKSAEQGNAYAQCSLGFCCEKGYGVEMSMINAVKWYRKSAEQGNATAQLNLGICYYIGKGVTQNSYEAVIWYRKSAEQGNARAQTWLGYCCEYGKGVEKNIDDAVYWYRNSVERGDSDAECNLGLCYEYGKGVEKDMDKAVELYRKSAGQGNANGKKALTRLGYSAD